MLGEPLGEEPGRDRFADDPARDPFADDPATDRLTDEPPLYGGRPDDVPDLTTEPEPAAATAPAAVREEEHEEEEPAGRSLAARLLTALVLLIAGGALALWGAPRIAPHLPAGMAPVAAWLSPGQNAAEAQIAAVEAETSAALEALRGEVQALAAREPETGPIEERLGSLESDLSGRIDAISNDINALEGAGGGERLSRLEAALDGQEAALASLRDQLGAVEGVEGVTAEIDTYRADLDGLRAEVRELAGQVGGLAGRLEEVSAEANRRVEAAEARVADVQAEQAAALSEAQRTAALSLIGTALDAGAPYAEATATLSEDPELSVPEGLAAPAESGVATMAQLRDSFPDAAYEAIRASIMANAGDGVLERARAFAEAQVASRSLTPQPGNDPDAVLSRMEAALGEGDLDAVLSEAEALPGEAAAAMGPWLDRARARASALADYQTLEAELSATN
jgi:hypothetical protein